MVCRYYEFGICFFTLYKPKRVNNAVQKAQKFEYTTNINFLINVLESRIC